MADKTVTQLTELTAVDQNDIMYIVDDPSGTPTSKKVKAKNVLQSTNTLSANTTVDKNDRMLLIDDPTGTASPMYATVEDVLQGTNTLTANSTVALTDRTLIIDDPSGTPAAQYSTVQNFLYPMGLEHARTTALANNGVFSTGIFGGRGGFLMVVAETDYISAIYRLDGESFTVISANATFSNTATTAGKYNVYFSADQLMVENKVGSGKDITVKLFVVR